MYIIQINMYILCNQYAYILSTCKHAEGTQTGKIWLPDFLAPDFSADATWTPCIQLSTDLRKRFVSISTPFWNVPILFYKLPSTWIAPLRRSIWSTSCAIRWPGSNPWCSLAYRGGEATEVSLQEASSAMGTAILTTQANHLGWVGLQKKILLAYECICWIVALGNATNTMATSTKQR